MQTTVGVVGAGLTGLVSAYELRKRLGPNARIVLIDVADRIGGKLKTVASDEGPIEVGAEAFLAFRKDAVKFFTDIGLADQLVEPSSLPSMLYVGDSLHALPRNTVMGIPASPEGLGNLLDQQTLDQIAVEGDPEQIPPLQWIPGDDVLLGPLIEHRLGRQVVDRIVSPLLGGVYSTSADDLGLRATVPQLAHALDELATLGKPVSVTAAAAQVLEQRKQAAQARLASEDTQESSDESSADAKKEKPAPIFLTFRDGYQVVYDRLLELAAPELVLNTEVTGMTQVGDDGNRRWQLAADAAALDSVQFDAMVLASPAPATAKILENVSKDASSLISSVDLASSAVVAMRFDSDENLPNINGVLVAADADLDAKAFTLSSRKWPHLHERGGAIVRASFGRFGDDSLVKLDDEELVSKARADLETATGFNAAPVETYVQRWWGGLPRYNVGHADLMGFADQELAAFDTVAVAGAWHSSPGVPACIADAKVAVSKIIEAVL